MAIVWVKAWECDDCGHRWLQTGSALPSRCPNRDCRSTKPHRLAAGETIYPTATAPDILATVQYVPVADIYQRPKHDPTCRCAMCRP